jgi:hypothetical protein
MCPSSKWGLEISGIAAIDVDNNFAFHLEAVQTLGSKGDPNSDENLLDWYGNVLFERKETLAKLSSYIVADAFFAKKPFAEDIIKYYRSRFQIEFLYRDGKHHTGLEHSQARTTNKLQFHLTPHSLLLILQGFAIGFRCPKKKGKPFQLPT